LELTEVKVKLRSTEKWSL